MMEQERDVYIDQDSLRKLCVSLLEKAGVPWREGLLMADGIVAANLRGVDSHGVMRLESYLKAFENGSINTRAAWSILKETPGSISVDGMNSSGFVTGVKVMGILQEKAKQCGCAMASVRNSSHFGMAAYYSMMPLERGMIGIAICNTPPYMAPWGGSKAFFGTNPISVAIPAGEYCPIVLDMSTSVSARGKVMLAEKEGRVLPEGWALDERGVATTDPQRALNGTLLPTGGPKGYGLALIIDILSGVLSGGAYGPYINNTDKSPGANPLAGHCFAVIDIESFVDKKLFEDKIAELIDEIKSVSKAPGVEEIYIPGELEFIMSKQRASGGIPVSREIADMLERLAERYGLDEKPGFRENPFDEEVFA